MKKGRGRKPKAFSEALYRLLLQFYPRAFRREYGELMQQAYRDLCRDAEKNRGLLGVLSLWGRILSDFVPSVLWEYLDDYERGGGMKKIIIQEMFRALAIGWAAMLFLAYFFYKGLGWSSELVLLLTVAIGLLSFISFTIFRSKSGKELMIRTRRGWITFGEIWGIILLAYFVMVYNRNMSFLDNFFPLLLGFIALAFGVWWGISQVSKSEQRGTKNNDSN
jgi:hypothetical protein